MSDIGDPVSKRQNKTKPTESKHTRGVTPLLHSFPVFSVSAAQVQTPSSQSHSNIPIPHSTYYDLLNASSELQFLHSVSSSTVRTESHGKPLQAELIPSGFSLWSAGTDSPVSSLSHLGSLASATRGFRSHGSSHT